MTDGAEGSAFRVVELHGTVGELHAADPFTAAGEPALPVLWWCRPTAPALVLGSRQSMSMAAADACARLGIDVVRRRSGGGAVLVEPDRTVWVDLVIPRLATPDGAMPDGAMPDGVMDDIRASMVWAGERWAGAVDELAGPHTTLTVHHGGMVPTPWSDHVCFAGIGPGEVLLGGRKLVGLSQRRTRRGLRIQGLFHTAPASVDITTLMAFDPAPAGAPAEVATLAGEPELVVRRLSVGGKWGRMGEIG